MFKEERNMNKYRFEPSFDKAIKRQLRGHSLKLFCLALPVLLIAVLYISFRYYGDTRFLKYILPGILGLFWLILLALDIRSWCWVSRRHAFTERGILVKDFFGRERAISWSAMASVDVGFLSLSGAGTVKVIRCFLTSKAAARLSPNLSHKDNDFFIGDYYKFRNECAVLSYSEELEQYAVGCWRRIREEEDAALAAISASEEDFEYTFGSEIRGYFQKINGVVLALVYYGICAVVILLDYLKDGYQETDPLVWGMLLLFIPLVAIYAFKPDQKPIKWLQTSRCKLCKDGIYLQMPKEKIEFVPWEDFAVVERQQMNLDRGKSVYVICCYRSLTAKAILEHTPTGGTKHLMHRVFYQHRDEIVTLGYDGKRMAKIRALRGTGMSKSGKMQQLRNREWYAYERDRDL